MGQQVGSLTILRESDAAKSITFLLSVLFVQIVITVRGKRKSFEQLLYICRIGTHLLLAAVIAIDKNDKMCSAECDFCSFMV